MRSVFINQQNPPPPPPVNQFQPSGMPNYSGSWRNPNTHIKQPIAKEDKRYDPVDSYTEYFKKQDMKNNAQNQSSQSSNPSTKVMYKYKFIL